MPQTNVYQDGNLAMTRDELGVYRLTFCGVELELSNAGGCGVELKVNGQDCRLVHPKGLEDPKEEPK